MSNYLELKILKMLSNGSSSAGAAASAAGAAAGAGAATTNTTIGAVITNGKFDKTQLTKIAALASNGLVRAVRPVNTTADGDSIFALSVGEVACDLNLVGTAAAYVVEKAIHRAVYAAESAYGAPAHADIARA